MQCRLAHKPCQHLQRSIDSERVESARCELKQDTAIAATQFQYTATMSGALTSVEADIVEAHVLRHIDVVQMCDGIVIRPGVVFRRHARVQAISRTKRVAVARCSPTDSARGAKRQAFRFDAAAMNREGAERSAPPST